MIAGISNNNINRSHRYIYPLQLQLGGLGAFQQKWKYLEQTNDTYITTMISQAGQCDLLGISTGGQDSDLCGGLGHMLIVEFHMDSVITCNPDIYKTT